MDEASSRLRMQVDSKPEELDELDRRIIQLKIEREALKKESDQASKDRLARLQKEIADLEEKSSSLARRWKEEKEKLASAQRVKEELDAARIELEQVQRRGDLARAGELSYGVIPDLEKRLKAMENAADSRRGMVEEAVTPDHIAGVVSRWTGIPVEKMLQGEKDKLLRMEDELGKRVVGQSEAVHSVSTAVRRPAPGCKTRTGPSARSCSWGRPASARPSFRVRWPVSCSPTTGPWSASICPNTGEALRRQADRRPSRL